MRRERIFKIGQMLLMYLLATAGSLRAGTISVGPGAGYDFYTIQGGIDAASDGDTVLVAAGEYVITVPITFQGKAITVRSETGPDETTIRMGTPVDANRGSVVVFENNETRLSVLEGFTITGGTGFRLWVPPESGFARCCGGIFFDASSGTVRNCAIVQNRAKHVGGVLAYSGAFATLIDCIVAGNTAEGGVCGGVMCWSNSRVTMTKCTIAGNSSVGHGGGVYCRSDEFSQESSLTMTDCVISENSSADAGGGVACWYGSLILTRCALLSNTGGYYFGGAVYAGHGSATLTNCIIVRNTAALGGGGVASSYPDASVTISNCTIWGNSGGGECGGGGVLCRNAFATVTNSIIWGNASPKGSQISVQDPASTLTIASSDIAGGQAGAGVEGGCTLDWGEGNIDADPLFAQPGHWADINDPNVVVEPDDPNAMWIDGDYHVKSEVGRWDPYSESWVIDDVTSPCIDRGDPHSPVGDEPDPNGGRINMGAYGGTPQASMSIGQLPPLPSPEPLAHWKLDEIEGDIAYDSAGVNDGAVMGLPAWHPDAGQVDGALELDGSCFVAVDFVLNPSDGPFSVLAWVKGGVPGQGLVSQQAGANWLMVDAATGALMTELKSANRLSRALCSETVITDGNWHRIGFTWDGADRRLYVDDALVAEDTQGYLAECYGGLNIGCGKDMAPATFWEGLIDDVRIYNRVVQP